MNNEEKAQIMKCSRQSLASVKLEKKYRSMPQGFSPELKRTTYFLLFLPKNGEIFKNFIFSLAQKDDVKKILLHHKNILSNSLVQEERELSEELSEPSSCPSSSGIVP